MNSRTATEVRPSPTSTSDPRDLLVLWQNPKTRSIDVVGRLQLNDGTYTFWYTRRSEHVEGFRPLPGLRDTKQVYESRVLFPLFAQRVMDPSRPGYERYLSRLGLSTDESTPWEQILRSGGRREGDTLQFLSRPQTQSGRAEAIFLAHGVRWIPMKRLLLAEREISVSGVEQERALSGLTPGDELGLLPEPRNPSSELATLITAAGTPIGYVPQVLAGGIRRIADAARLRVVRINGPDAPPHLRLVVRLDAEVSPDFSFDPDGDWEPIVGHW